MLRPYRVPLWIEDPLPLGAQAYAPWSAAYWRLVTVEALRARR